MLFKFYSEHAMGSCYPSDRALVGCLKDLLKLPGLAPVYFILDALDECSRTETETISPRLKVLNFIEELTKSGFPNLHICLTSRPAPGIKGVLDPLNFHSVSLHDESAQKRDIEDYIKWVINDHRSIGWKAEDKQLVINFLTEKVDGM
jgi:hypothetical protein